jgi:hypothetical protein
MISSREKNPDPGMHASSPAINSPAIKAKLRVEREMDCDDEVLPSCRCLLPPPYCRCLLPPAAASCLLPIAAASYFIYFINTSLKNSTARSSPGCPSQKIACLRVSVSLSFRALSIRKSMAASFFSWFANRGRMVYLRAPIDSLHQFYFLPRKNKFQKPSNREAFEKRHRTGTVGE